MTERKPPGMDQTSWVDQQISAAIARGEFDDLPGQGKPIADLDKPYDEVWFGRKLRDEGFDTEAMLPASLRLRKRLERLPEQVAELRSEDEVRRTVAELNEEVEAYLRMPSGPSVPIAPVDPDQIVLAWRARPGGSEGVPKDERPAGDAGASGPPPEENERRRRPWWRRLVRS